jgi:hypothetical protein
MEETTIVEEKVVFFLGIVFNFLVNNNNDNNNNNNNKTTTRKLGLEKSRIECSKITKFCDENVMINTQFVNLEFNIKDSGIKWMKNKHVSSLSIYWSKCDDNDSKNNNTTIILNDETSNNICNFSLEKYSNISRLKCRNLQVKEREEYIEFSKNKDSKIKIICDEQGFVTFVIFTCSLHDLISFVNQSKIIS